MLRTWNRRIKLLMLLPIFLNSLNIFFIYLIPQMILQFCYLRLYSWRRNCFLLSVNRWKCFCTSAVNHRKKFPHFLSYLLIAYLITVSLEKEITVLEKGLEKVLNFGSKNRYKLCNNILWLLLPKKICLPSSS